jgi:hypothetical protein
MIDHRAAARRRGARRAGGHARRQPGVLVARATTGLLPGGSDLVWLADATCVLAHVETCLLVRETLELRTVCTADDR